MFLLAAAMAAQEALVPAGRPATPSTASLPASLAATAAKLDDLSVILGRPTDKSVTLNILSSRVRQAYVEYGTAAGAYTLRSEPLELQAGQPRELTLGNLAGNTRYFYRLQCRGPKDTAFAPDASGSFQTQRSPGSTFIFGVQGDSHPDRPGKMYDPDLYTQTMRHVASDAPDFYIALGDDFSIERLIERRMLSQAAVDRIYASQRPFLGAPGGSAALFLVNGNHEQAARCNLDGTAGNCAVMAGLARIRYYSLPAPDGFYSGDAEGVKHLGLPRDYYSWTWGDALFVVIDPYWHSPVTVDNEAGAAARDGAKNDDARRRDLWDVTMGDAQYKWLSRTLLESKARWKFVFAHHVLGTGRGGIECAGLYEWGGQNRRGDSEFAAKRPGWQMPIHQLMVKAGVTIFFQGHDHLFARQELDGVVYQSCPNPADPTYTAFNRDAYRTGDVLPNSGHLRVTVGGGEKVRVEYVRSYLPGDATRQHPDGEVALAYELPAGKPTTAPATSPAAGGVVAAGAKLVELASGLKFTEGPVADAEGNVYFSDVKASRIYKWSPDGGARLFREDTGSANGLAIDGDGNLIACQSATGRIVCIDPRGELTIVADEYGGKRFNQTNDLWIDPKGGIYFSDPIYGRAENAQGGEHVYYISPDRRTVTRVIDDMVRPNGLVGSPDGRTLYVADHGADKTFRYAIRPDGTLADKTLFAASGSDGLKLDGEGNLYFTTDAVVVYSALGKQIARIETPQQPTNLCFAGRDHKTLFITARTGIYSIQLAVSGPASWQPAATSRPGAN
jgi:sugar lactone lactonase YvrE